MNKGLVVAGALACVLAMPLAGCGSSSGSSASTSTSAASTSAATSSFDAVSFYQGQWRGSVEITGQTVYGTAGGNEQMLDVNLEADGTCTVKPLAAHADLLDDSGTWEGTADEVTLHLTKGDVTLKVVDKATLTGTASDFGITDFDTINFDFYG
ncbi:MAG: hypothetical protein LKI25_06375 [Atopobiaceae bacterium]|nr:hypothetical protein [Atopobiaceae bacterium]MCI2173823.1 hypothetical protein [Atopobiaceae bacterium]MCI2207535.1 hypothetical protein [Atopobiaceae bacterium]